MMRAVREQHKEAFRRDNFKLVYPAHLSRSLQALLASNPNLYTEDANAWVFGYDLGHVGFSFNLYPHKEVTQFWVSNYVDLSKTEPAEKTSSDQFVVYPLKSQGWPSHMVSSFLPSGTEEGRPLALLDAAAAPPLQSHPSLSVHSGAIGSAIDDAFGVLNFWREDICATLNLSLQFMAPLSFYSDKTDAAPQPPFALYGPDRPAALSHFQVSLFKEEKRKKFFTANIYNDLTGQLCATATALFYSFTAKSLPKLASADSSSSPSSSSPSSSSPSSSTASAASAKAASSQHKFTPKQGTAVGEADLLPFPDLSHPFDFHRNDLPGWVGQLLAAARQPAGASLDATPFLTHIVTARNIEHFILSSPKVRSRYILHMPPPQSPTALPELTGIYEFTAISEGPPRSVHGGAIFSCAADVAEACAIFACLHRLNLPGVRFQDIARPSSAGFAMLAAQFPDVFTEFVSTNYKQFLPLLEFFKWSCAVESTEDLSDGSLRLRLQILITNPETGTAHGDAQCIVRVKSPYMRPDPGIASKL